MINSGDVRRIFWFISTLEDVNFARNFDRFYDGEISYIHTNFITFIYSKFLLKKRSYIPRLRVKKIFSCPDVSKCFNVISGRLSEEEAKKAYLGIKQLLERKVTKKMHKGCIFMIPSGRHIHHIAATDFAKMKSIKRLYINYANFPGYTIFDPSGTDRESLIYKKKSFLKNLSKKNYDDIAIKKIYEYFSRLKKEQKTIPQKASTGVQKTLKAYLFRIDTCLQRLLSVYGDRRVRFHYVAVMREQVSLLSTIDIENVKEDFIFFPLQVSTDQQILVNYEKGNIFSAIDEAVDCSRILGKTLVIKEHPAESEIEKIRSYLHEKISKGDRIIFTTSSVQDAIKAAKLIITVNSTVGLEGLLRGKEVRFLGDSFYKKCSKEELAIYLSEYFIKVDYHTGKGLSRKIIKEILARVNLHE